MNNRKHRKTVRPSQNAQRRGPTGGGHNALPDSSDLKTTTESKLLPLPIPLNRELWLKNLQETIQKLKDAGQTVSSYAIILETEGKILESEWNREKLLETNSPSQERFVYVQ